MKREGPQEICRMLSVHVVAGNLKLTIPVVILCKFLLWLHNVIGIYIVDAGLWLHDDSILTAA